MAGRLREMRCELSFLKNADGSACFSQGATCIWASCSGPGDVHASKASDEAMTLDISYRANCGDNKFNVLNNIIHSTLSNAINLELFPHTTISVTVHGIQDDGSMGAVAINGACFALLDNGMPFETVFCGVLIVRVKDELIIDPTAKQEAASTGRVLFSVCKGSDGHPEVCAMDAIGHWDFIQLEAAWSLAQPSASAIFDFYKTVMKRKLSVDEQ
ncbi:Exosome complex component RRP46 homolog [Caenorhabditis elegans]|uniref:Exosome complex component RRP46 homolog n=2 Tax=Caenorhabditis elegans TaxID=6239 RepID=EXOS5_CAEEL|nr:Exosome complex component RRP46 homolog [Caenorhabditis elegans]G5EG59.1 RecName: Full=Exosome complex component RRP46 homolog; AltName: Full=Cell death-related nuclease 5 [Caenorhabditis elegans]AAP57301.1 cell death-related nuclease 5 [Caenorhabditis elegans]CAA90109.1 Exosome complex component RRP46 homolog [Caenorhabditis elegans]|eukprot:NP_496284.1 Cell-death-Related Nuclease [Caenorhabditis elegans]